MTLTQKLIGVAIFVSAVGTAYVAFKPAIDKAYSTLVNDINYIINKANGTTPHAIGCKISASPLQGPTPLTVSFASNPTGGTTPYQYAWDFGDGTTSTQANPQHVYAAGVTGNLKVVLKVTDSKNQVATDSIFVAPGQVTQPPIGPGPTQPPTTTPFQISIFNVMPNPLKDGQQATLGVTLINGSGQFIGGIQWGDGKGETLHFDGWDATLTHVYNLGNSADKTLDIVLTVLDETTQQTVIKHLSFTVNPANPSTSPPPQPTGLSIKLQAPTVDVHESGDFVKVTIGATNTTSTPEVFKLILEILGPNGEAITINSIGINPLNAGASQSFVVQSSFIPLAYIGKNLTAQVFAWDSNNVPVGNSVSTQFVF